MDKDPSKSQDYYHCHNYLLQRGSNLHRTEDTQVNICFDPQNNQYLVAKTYIKSNFKEVKGHRAKSILFNEGVLQPLLNHRNISEVYDIIKSKNYFILLMPYHQKGDLLKMLKSNPLDKRKIRYFATQLLLGVEYLHSYGLCHRDLKLDNLFITSDDTLKIGDLAFAEFSRDGVMTDKCGTKHYLPPEAFTSPEYNGFAADMWAVGIIIYAMFTRSLPFKSSDALDFTKEIDFKYVDPPYIPIIQSLLNIRNPEARPTASELLEHPLFECQGQQRFPPHSRVVDPFDQIDTELIHSLARRLNKSPDYVNDIISCEEYGIYHCCYALLSEGVKLSYDLPDLSARFKTKANTAPVVRASDIYTAEITLKADSSQVLKILKNYFFSTRHSSIYISGLNYSPRPSVVFNLKEVDKKFDFEVEDVSDGQITLTKLTLYAESDSVDMAKSTIQAIRRNSTAVVQI